MDQLPFTQTQDPYMEQQLPPRALDVVLWPSGDINVFDFSPETASNTGNYTGAIPHTSAGTNQSAFAPPIYGGMQRHQINICEAVVDIPMRSGNQYTIERDVGSQQTSFTNEQAYLNNNEGGSLDMSRWPLDGVTGEFLHEGPVSLQTSCHSGVLGTNGENLPRTQPRNPAYGPATGPERGSRLSSYYRDSPYTILPNTHQSTPTIFDSPPVTTPGWVPGFHCLPYYQDHELAIRENLSADIETDNRPPLATIEFTGALQLRSNRFSIPLNPTIYDNVITLHSTTHLPPLLSTAATIITSSSTIKKTCPSSRKVCTPTSILASSRSINTIAMNQDVRRHPTMGIECFVIAGSTSLPINNDALTRLTARDDVSEVK